MTSPDTGLVQALRSWDQKSAAAIVDIYNRFRRDNRFLPNLIAACQDANCACGATWLIKHHCEEGATAFTEDDRHQFYLSLATMTHWETKLHALQTIQYVPVPPRRHSDVRGFVEACLDDPNKLVLAWAYYGIAQLAHQFPEERDDAISLLQDAALQYPSGAIAVRIRKALALLA